MNLCPVSSICARTVHCYRYSTNKIERQKLLKNICDYCVNFLRVQSIQIGYKLPDWFFNKIICEILMQSFGPMPLFYFFYLIAVILRISVPWKGSRRYISNIFTVTSLFKHRFHIIGLLKISFWNPVQNLSVLIEFLAISTCSKTCGNNFFYYLYNFTERKSKFLYTCKRTENFVWQNHVDICIIVLH